MLVAVPACVAAGHIRVAGHIHERMAVAAIHPELIDVDFVGKRNRLARLIAHRERLRRRIISECQSHARCGSASADSDFKGQEIGPTRKNICHR